MPRRPWRTSRRPDDRSSRTIDCNCELRRLVSHVRLAPKEGYMSTTVDARLERNAVGLAPTLFQSITHMAPAAAVAFSIIVRVPYAGGSIPLAVLLALVACLLIGGFATTLMAKAGGSGTDSVSAPNRRDQHGLGLVFPGMIFAIPAFLDFQAWAPLGEGARDPRRPIPRAVIVPCVLIGVFYL